MLGFALRVRASRRVRPGAFPSSCRTRGRSPTRSAVVRSMHTDQFNHAPAQLFMNTGHFRVGRPSMGSWLTYGLGTENQDLPGFVVMLSGKFAPSGGASCWGSGFLPTVHQGVRFRSQGDPVLFLSDPPGMEAGRRRRVARCDRQTQWAAPRASGGPRDRDAHRPVRAGLSHANQRARAAGDRLGTRASRARDVRRRAREGLLRQQLPPRAAG